MNNKTRIVTALLCFAVFPFVAPAAFSQAEPDKPKTGDAPKTDDEKKKPAADSVITVRFQMSAQGKTKIPSNSTIELSGEEESCKTLRVDKHVDPDGVTFSDLPVCKVKLLIFISGFNSKTVSLDLGKYKDGIKITINANGPPVVSTLALQPTS